MRKNSQVCYEGQSQAFPWMAASLWVTGPTEKAFGSIWSLQLRCRVSLLICFYASKETQPSQNIPTPGNESLSNNHSRSLIGLPVHKNCGYCRSSYLSSFFELFANRTVEESQLSKKKEGRKDRNLVTHRLHRTQAIHKTSWGNPECSVQFLHRKAKNHQLLVCLSSATGVRMV